MHDSRLLVPALLGCGVRTYTWDDVLKRADELVEADDDLIYDVAAERGQLVDNVKHMRWFRYHVALELISTTKKYEDVRVPEVVNAGDHG